MVSVPGFARPVVLLLIAVNSRNSCYQLTGLAVPTAGGETEPEGGAGVITFFSTVGVALGMAPIR